MLYDPEGRVTGKLMNVPVLFVTIVQLVLEIGTL
jgi:hypothetical protein